MDILGFELVLILVLVMLNGVLAGSELAVVSARPLRLQQRAAKGDAGAKAALQLATEPNRFLSTVQIGITLVGIFTGAFGGATVAAKLDDPLSNAGLSPGAAATVSVLIVVLGITYLSLVMGELVPKRLALAHPETIARAVARPLKALSVVATPGVVLLSVSTDAVLRLLRVRTLPESALTEEELRALLLQGAEAGVIDVVEQQMAAAVLRLGDRSVLDLMTPRLDAIWIDVNQPIAAAWRTIETSPHQRYPLCEDDSDNVIGIVAAKHLLAAFVRGETPDLRAAAQPPLFIPESLSVLAALEQFRQARATFAVVVDEYGGTGGIITLTDVLEAIVGDLPAEEATDDGVVVRADGSLLIDGGLPLSDLHALLSVDQFPGERAYQTLAGFILHELGRIPALGESVDWSGFRFEVVDMDARRIDRVLIERAPPADPPER